MKYTTTTTQFKPITLLGIPMPVFSKANLGVGKTAPFFVSTTMNDPLKGKQKIKYHMDEPEDIYIPTDDDRKREEEVEINDPEPQNFPEEDREHLYAKAHQKPSVKKCIHRRDNGGTRPEHKRVDEPILHQTPMEEYPHRIERDSDGIMHQTTTTLKNTQKIVYKCEDDDKDPDFQHNIDDIDDRGVIETSIDNDTIYYQDEDGQYYEVDVDDLIEYDGDDGEITYHSKSTGKVIPASALHHIQDIPNYYLNMIMAKTMMQQRVIGA